jgi:MFS family permease
MSAKRGLLCVRCGLPFSYGYIAVVVATVGKIMSSPGQSPCIGVMIECIMSNLQLSRSTISALYLVATCASAASLPQVGQLVDRVGVQRFVALNALLLGGACALFASCTSSLMLLLCFYLLRLLGQGAIFLVSVTAINLWWVKRRGLMMGIAGAGAQAGITALVPVLFLRGLETIGWRQTYLVLAAVSAFGMAPLGWAFYREAPERYGLLPDGLRRAPLAEGDGAVLQHEASMIEAPQHNEPTQRGAAEAQALEPEWTRADALRTGAFWSMSMGSLSIALTGTAFCASAPTASLGYALCSPSFLPCTRVRAANR